MGGGGFEGSPRSAATEAPASVPPVPSPAPSHRLTGAVGVLTVLVLGVGLTLTARSDAPVAPLSVGDYEAKLASGQLECDGLWMTSVVDGNVIPGAVVSLHEALEFFLREELPRLDEAVPDESTGPGEGGTGFLLRVQETTARLAYFEHNNLQLTAGLRLDGEVWYVTGSSRCDDFNERYRREG
jgi:hypothetical protein